MSVNNYRVLSIGCTEYVFRQVEAQFKVQKARHYDDFRGHRPDENNMGIKEYRDEGALQPTLDRF